MVAEQSTNYFGCVAVIDPHITCFLSKLVATNGATTRLCVKHGLFMLWLKFVMVSISALTLVLFEFWCALIP
jgi:hypothetical protein